MNKNTELFLKHTGIELPLICGAMYPCSNPELIAAVSDAGGIVLSSPSRCNMYTVMIYVRVFGT